MNQSPRAVFELLKKVLREDVQPELTSDHANVQLAGVLDILEKMERQLSPNPDLLRQKLVILRAASAEAGGTWSPESPADQSALEQTVKDGEAELRRLTDLAFDPTSALDATQRAALHALLLATLKKLLQVERSVVPRANFGAMTSSAKKPENGGV